MLWQDFSPRMFVSDSDFIAITKNGALCNSQGNLGQEEFEVVMREQLRLYAQSRLSSTSEYWATSDQDFTPLSSLKQILMEQLSLKNEQEAMRKEFRLYAQSRVSSTSEDSPLSSLKQILMEQLSLKNEQEAMRKEFRLYAQSRVSSTSEDSPLSSLKQILMEQLSLKNEQEAMRKELSGVVMEMKEEMRQFMWFLHGGTAEGISKVGSSQSQSKPKKKTKSKVLPDLPDASLNHTDHNATRFAPAQNEHKPDGNLRSHTLSCAERRTLPASFEAQDTTEKQKHAVVPVSSSHGDVCFVTCQNEQTDSASRYLETHRDLVEKSNNGVHKTKMSQVPMSECLEGSPGQYFEKAGFLKPVVLGQVTCVQNIMSPDTGGVSVCSTPNERKRPPGLTLLPSLQQGTRKDNCMDVDLVYTIRSSSGPPNMRRQFCEEENERVTDDPSRSHDVEMLHSAILRMGRSARSLRTSMSNDASPRTTSRFSGIVNGLEIDPLESKKALWSHGTEASQAAATAVPSWKTVRRRGGT